MLDQQIDLRQWGGQWLPKQEQCGWQLYRVVGERTTDPELRERYEEFGRETDRHRTILTGLIRDLGGDPDYVSPTARLAQANSPELKVKEVHPAPMDRRNLLETAKLPAAEPAPASRTSPGG